MGQRVTAEAVEDLFEQQAGSLVHRAARIVVDQADAEDAVADAFESLLRHELDDPAAAPAWLGTAAQNRARGMIRARERERARAIRTLEPSAPEPGLPTDPAVVRLLGEALAELPDRERAAVEHRVVHGGDIADLASRLGVSTMNARVIVHRGLRRLRRSITERLADHHHVDGDCRRALDVTRLRDAAHCLRCSPLVDELQALAGRTAVLGAPSVGARVRSVLEHTATRLSDLAHGTPTAGEAAAAALAGLLAMHGVLPGPDGDPGASAERPAAVAPVDAPAASVAAPSPVALAPVSVAAVATMPVAPAEQSPAATGARVTDPVDDDDQTGWLQPTADAPGGPYAIAILGNQHDAGASDIEFVEIQAVDGERGLAALRFVIEMARPPVEDVAWQITWRHRDEPCSVDLSTGTHTDRPDRRYGWARFDCAQETTDRSDPLSGWFGGSHPAAGQVNFEGAVSGTTVVLELHVNRLTRGQQRLLHPGALLTDLRLTARTSSTRDSVPDTPGGATYRLPPDDRS